MGIPLVVLQRTAGPPSGLRSNPARAFHAVSRAGGTTTEPEPERHAHPPTLVDSHGRTIRDLRLSITDRCNFRCLYCLDPGTRFLDASSLLSDDELVRLARVCVSMGVRKIRLTGGEPTLHPRLTSLIARIAALPIDDLAMTTNGSRCDPGSLAEWKRAGLKRLTFSLDAVEPAAFARLTRAATPVNVVLDAIRGAQRAGFGAQGPIRVNAVLLRGHNDDQVVPLARLARDLGVEVRFIEFMPLDDAHGWSLDRMVPAREVIDTISAAFPLVPLGKAVESSTSDEFSFADGAIGGVGVIAPVTRPFCGACSRLRVTADGQVRPCLFSREEWDARAVLRDGGNDATLARFLADTTWSKQPGHGIAAPGFAQPARTMSAIGG